MFFNYFYLRLKAIFLFILSLFRRALCCFPRRRRNSNSDCEVLSSINVVNNDRYSTVQHKERDWNSWDDAPKTVDEHIERYRQQLVKPSTPKDEEPSIDFFEDMTPRIKKQTKLLIKTDTTSDIPTNNFSRLQAGSIPVVTASADLEDITDDETKMGWEEISDENTKQLIIEKRREIRAQRKQQKLNENKSSIQKTQQIIAERIRN